MPVAPPGLVQIDPPFEGCELIWSSATILSYDWFGEYRLDVVPGVVVGAPHNILSATHADTVPAVLVAGDILYADATPDLTRLAVGNPGDVLSLVAGFPNWVAPGAIGVLWEAANSYRGGAASLEPVLAQDGVPLLVQDATATWYNIRAHDGTDNVMDSNAGDWQFWTTGVGSRLEVYAPGQVPPMGGGAPSNNQVFMGHDAVDAVVGCAAGDLELNAAADVYTMDDVGIGIAAPTEALHVVGNPRFVTGAEGAGTVWHDDGTGTGVGEWTSVAAIKGGVWFLYDTASGDIAGYDTLFADPSVGVQQTYTVLIPASPTLIEEFATEIGEPGITFIDDGIAEFHFDARQSAGTMDIRVYAEIYTRTLVPVETLIATTELSNILTGVQASYEIHAIIPFTTMAVTDRLVVKVYANQIPPGANPTIQFYVEGATATRLELPGSESSSALPHMMAAVPYNAADPTPVILEAGVSEEAEDFFVEVNCHDLNSNIVWPALGSRIPVAELVTYYWEVVAGNLTVNIVNDSQADIVAIIWWSR